MESVLNVVFDGVDFNIVSPVGLLCVYLFALIIECIASIINSTLKVGGLN